MQQQRRPHLYPAAKPALTTEQQVAALQKGAATASADLSGVKADLSDLTDTVADQGAALDMVASTVETISDTVAGLPATNTLWSDARPTATFGTGSDVTWTGTGNGAAVTFNIPGRISTTATRYVVLVGGVRQAPAAYSLSTSAATLTFGEAPPDGVLVAIHAPFYGSSAP